MKNNFSSLKSLIEDYNTKTIFIIFHDCKYTKQIIEKTVYFNNNVKL